VDLVSALGMAGLKSVVMADPDDPVRFSRHVVGTLPKLDHWTEPEKLVSCLIQWALAQEEKAVLIPQTDGDLLLVSRNRAALSPHFRFTVADEWLLEQLIHKDRFQVLAHQLQLDVPAAHVISTDTASTIPRGMRLPVVVKPLTRRGLAGLSNEGKAIRIDSEAEFQALRGRRPTCDLDLLVQELVPGPESRIESWHGYIDDAGKLAGQFCGRKVRTWPLEYGHSTALQITATPDVARAGQDIAERLSLRGLVKMDFKRDPAGVLRLLEVNPRATLWLHPGAVAGVNLAALLHADLAEIPRPPVLPLRTGVTWCAPRDDWRAARALGMSRSAWLAWTLRCPARSGASWSDPTPFLRGQLAPALMRRLARAAGRSRTEPET
jgi:predicted ATP-grasp superfamily ATP-dependent carboligase